MQIFLLHPGISGFALTARALDWRRLGKQRVEARQVLDVVLGRRPGSRWSRHPAVRMWRPFPKALSLYLRTMIREWKRRGYRNTMEEEFLGDSEMDVETVPFLYHRPLYSVQRRNMLRKDPSHYRDFAKEGPPANGYLWYEDGAYRLVQN